MRLVVDASVAVKWFLFETGSEAARALLAAEATRVAPEFVLVEIANVLRKRMRTGTISAEQAVATTAALPMMFDELVPTARLLTRAVTIARELDHPAFDCFYLAVAEEPDSRLVSNDSRLLRRISGTAWAATSVALNDWNRRWAGAGGSS